MNDQEFINELPTKCFISGLPTQSEYDGFHDYRYSVIDDLGRKHIFQFEYDFRPTELINKYKDKIWEQIKSRKIIPADLAGKELITVQSLEAYIKGNFL
ncbi:MAG: hypothetical protein JRJ57_00360 [Deltaproteobacteria bacterium]|nr:hypothetical protein [Deltaproteobacteria bacterium]